MSRANRWPKVCRTSHYGGIGTRWAHTRFAGKASVKVEVEDNSSVDGMESGQFANAAADAIEIRRNACAESPVP